MKKFKTIIIRFLVFLFFLFTFLLNFSINWAVTNYNDLTIDEIVFTLTTNVAKTESSLIYDFIKDVVITSFVCSTILLFLVLTILYILKKNSILIKISFFKKSVSIKLRGLLTKIVVVLLLLSAIGTITYFSFKRVGLIEYLKYISADSNFIKENYINPRKTKIVFPKKKHNLIYIYAESLESTYFSNEYGGYEDVNLLPGLVELTDKNINFSNNEQFGGARTLTGSGWTSAAMVAQTSGLPVKLSLNTNSANMKSYLKGAYTLGNVLEDNGYKNYLVLGSDAKFGNRKLYFETHGNYKIYDFNSAKRENFVDDDYYVWWGLEDSKLFNYAKLKLTEIAAKEEPFNFTMLTSNTHHPDGYLEESCSTNYDDQLANVIACSSYQLNDFIEWIKKQDFYKDTTIIIVGDHLHMNQDYFKKINYRNRRVYNLFINSTIKSNNTMNRDFSTMDMFPTTIASLGGKIDGDRLGLGVNLFSNEKTILEKYGYVKSNSELAKNSKFYTKNIIK